MRSLGAFGILVLMSIVLCSISITTMDSVAVGRPVVTINIGQTEMGVKVGPDDTGTVTFTGEVTAEVPLEVRVQYLVVSLTYVAGKGAGEWVAVGTSQVIFPRGVNTQQFTCNVKVPLGTSHSESGTLEVTGTWRYSPGSESGEATPDSAAIIILPYSQPVLEIDVTEIKVEKNEIAEYKLKLENRGNGPDEFSLSLKSDPGMLIEDDFPDKLVMNQNDKTEFTIKARSNSEGSKKISVKVSGSFETPKSVVNETLTLEVASKNIVESAKGFLIPGIAAVALIGAAGGGAFYFVRGRKKRRIRPISVG